MSFDAINGLFELVGGFLMWLNVYTLHRDKHMAGVSMLPTGFFICWGLWNLAFYSSLGQWWSLWGGVNLVIANAVWWGQMAYYRLAVK